MPFQRTADTVRYNEFVAQAVHGHFMQTTHWRDIKCAFGWQDGGQYILEKDGKIAAVFSMLLRSKFGVKILYVPRGPLWDITDEVVTSEVFAFLKESAKKNKAFFIRVSPSYMNNEENVKQIFNKQGFFLSKKQLQTKATMLVDLQRSEDELLASFHEKTRYNIRLAARKGVTVSELKDETELKDFYQIMIKMAARQEYDLQSYDYYKYIWQNLPIAKIYLAKHDGKVIGGVVAFSFRDTAYYMYGGFDSDYRNLMGNYLVHWEIMRQSKIAGLKYYDLQGVPLIKDENHPMYGFYRFKKGFNGQEVEFIGEYDYAPVNFLYQIWQNLGFDRKQYLQ